MEKAGEVLGWFAAVCYFAAVADLFLKRIFKGWVVRLSKDSPFRTCYQAGLRLVVRYHRYFGMAAGLFAPLHLWRQLGHVRVSYSGVLAAVLMMLTAVLGTVIAYGRRPALVRFHRPAALTVLAVLLFHLVTKL